MKVNMKMQMKVNMHMQTKMEVDLATCVTTVLKLSIQIKEIVMKMAMETLVIVFIVSLMEDLKYAMDVTMIVMD